MMSNDTMELVQALRMPSVDGEDERGRALVVGRWLDRSIWALERLEDEPMGERLAAELLVTWQALARMAGDMPDAEERAALFASLDQVVRTRSVELAALAPEAFDLEAWREALRGYVAQVGPSLSTWDGDIAQYAVMLIEGLDDALLCEAALEALNISPPLSFASPLQAAAVEGAQAAHSLIPAYAFIQAGAAALDPAMSEATGSYPLWIALAQAYGEWGLRALFVDLGVAAVREGFAKQRTKNQRPAPPARPHTPQAVQSSTWRVRKPPSRRALSASTQAEDGDLYCWRGASMWEVRAGWPSVDDEDDEEVAFVVRGLPCAGELLVFGVPLKAEAGDNELMMTARTLRAVDDEQEPIVFVGEDGRVEVGVLEE